MLDRTIFFPYARIVFVISSCIERALPCTSGDSVNRPYFGPARLLARHNRYEIALESVGAAIGVRDTGDDADDSGCVPHITSATKIEYFALNANAANAFETIR